MTKLIKQLIDSGTISQSVADQLLAEHTIATTDDAVQEVMDAEADEFLANAILEMEDKSLAERRRIGKNKAIRANLQSQLCRQTRDGFNARKWAGVAWALKNQR